MTRHELFGDLVSAEEAAEALRIHPSTVRRWLQFGRVPGAFKAGRQWRVRPEDLRAYLEGQVVAEPVRREGQLVMEQLRPESEFQRPDNDVFRDLLQELWDQIEYSQTAGMYTIRGIGREQVDRIRQALET